MRSRMCGVVFALACLVSSSPVRAASSYTAVYVFGDSFSDVGNLHLASGGSQAAPPYYNGRFSNGPLWVEHIAGSYGHTLQPSLVGGTDFAFAGAEVLQAVSSGGATIPSVPQQVAHYLQAHGGKADPLALYILAGGGNDILNASGSVPAQQLGTNIALALEGAEKSLRDAGARNFLIPQLFDLSMAPAGKSNAAYVSQASAAMDDALKTLLDQDSLVAGVHISRLNGLALFRRISTDPKHFNFSNIATQCLVQTVCADPDHTLFWDEIHLSAFGHSVFAMAAETLLNP